MSNIDAEIIATRRLLHEAMALQTAGNLAEAEARYRMVIARDYRVPEILPILAGMLAQRGALDESLVQWDALLAIRPDHAVALHEKGIILGKLGRSDEAIASLA